MPEIWSQVPLVPGEVYNRRPLEIRIPYRPIIADFSKRFFSFGSCFSAYAAKTLTDLGFDSYFCFQSAFHFTASSLVSYLKILESGREYTTEDVYSFADSKKAMSPYHKGVVAVGDDAVEKVLSKMRDYDSRSKEKLKASNVVFVTLGNATYLKRKSTGEPICWRGGIPKSEYDVVSSSVEEIVMDLNELHQLLRRFCGNDVYLIVTISPQRYQWNLPPPEYDQYEKEDFYSYDELSNDYVHSSLDKAKLRVAVDAFLRSKRKERVEYFPSYEIVIDELRQEEPFAYNYQDHSHVFIPYTPRYTINRFLQSHCSTEVKEFLQWNRSFLLGKLPNMLAFEDLSGGEELGSMAIKLARYCRRLGCFKIADDTVKMLKAHGVVEVVEALEGVRKKSWTEIEVAEALGHPSPALPPLLEGAMAALDKLVEREEAGDRRVGIFGGGEHTRLLLEESNVSKLKIHAILDSKLQRSDIAVLPGLPVLPPAEIGKASLDVVIVSSITFQEEMAAQTQEYASNGVEVVRLYDPRRLDEAQAQLAQWLSMH